MSKLKYKAVLLDLDDTLYEYDGCNDAGRKAAFILCSNITGLPQDEIHDAFLIARKKINTTLHGTAASHNRLLYFHKLTEQLGLKDLSLPMTLYNAYWDTFLEKLEPRPGVVSFLQSLKGVPTCLLTDLTAHIQFRKIEKLKFDQYIDYMVTSEEVGVEKPAPEGFELALQKCGGIAAHEACMIGDNYLKDIKAATNLGLDAYWFTDEQNEVVSDQEYKFNSFNELCKLVVEG